MDAWKTAAVVIGALLLLDFIRARMAGADNEGPNGGLDRADLDRYPANWLVKRLDEVNERRTARDLPPLALGDDD